jgi:hypothetical protein
VTAVIERVKAEHQFIPVAQAAEQLGISRNSAIRRIKMGRLEAYQDPDNGYFYVSERSVKTVLRRLQALRAAATLPGSEPLDDRWQDSAADAKG